MASSWLTNIHRHLRVRFAVALALLLCSEDTGVDAGNSKTSFNPFTDGAEVGWQDNYQYMAFTVHGCVYSQVNNLEDLACQEKGSDDGTYVWYQMVNCRRAQVAYSVYASNSGSPSCSSSDYMDTMATMGGTYGFLSTLESYGMDKYASTSYLSDISECESDGNGYYTGLACSEDGDFITASFYDEHCLSMASTKSTMSSLTSALQKYSCYDCSGGMCNSLVYSSDSCSPNDYQVCSDVTGKKSNVYKKVASSNGSFDNYVEDVGYYTSPVGTKIKYIFGCFLLGASFIMFLGILSTKRRLRRMNIQRAISDGDDDDLDVRRHRRRHRHTRTEDGRSRRSVSKSRARSKSRSRRQNDEKSKRSRRSSSRRKREQQEDDPDMVWA